MTSRSRVVTPNSAAMPEGRFSVVDVGSLNGTYLKRGRIDSAAMLLSSGDEVQIGKFRLTFFAAPPRRAVIAG